MVLGLEDDGPSNQDILDKIDKSTEEIKAEINKVMDEVKEPPPRPPTTTPSR